MKRYVSLALLLFVTPFSFATSLINHEKVTDQQDCFRSVFADYDSWRNLMERKIRQRSSDDNIINQRLAQFEETYTKQKFIEYKDTIDCRTFEYEVDSHSVKGYVIKPKRSNKAMPVLVYNRGGNGNFGGVVFGAMMHYLFPIVQEGFVVIGSQYRGTHTRSDSYDEFGGADVKDVIALFEFIPHIIDADPERIGMYGASRGGMQTHLAARHVSNMKAIATIAGVTDLTRSLIDRPEMEKVYNNRIPNYVQNKQAELDKRSVITWVDQLSPDMPILLLHGTNDQRVSVEQTKAFAAKLSQYQIPHKMVLYPNDNHGLVNNKDAAREELVGWFKRHL